MHLIQQNPYRILGVLSNAKATEIDRNYRKLSAFLSAGDEVEFDYDFKCLGELVRTEDAAKGAKSKINLNQDKVLSALFWFYNGSNTDEPAFDALKDGDTISAYGIWEKISSSGEVTKRNYSAFLNLSTLFLNNSISNGSIDKTMLSDAIKLKLKFLESEFLNDFTVSVADETYKPSKEELQKKFIDEVHNVLVKSSKIKVADFINILTNLNFLTKQSILKNFTQIPIDEIEKKIETNKSNRKQNPAKAASLGVRLHDSTRVELSLLKSILGVSDLNYSRIADKLADEILQSGIDYFKHFKDSEKDPSSEAMPVLRLAKSVAVGKIIIDRCVTNIENLQEWIDDKPQREQQNKIVSDLEYLKDLIESYESKTESVANAKALLNAANPRIQNIKNVLGSSNELYLGISTRIASDAQGMLVSEVNSLQEQFSKEANRDMKYFILKSLQNLVNEAWGVTTSIGNMDLSANFKDKFNDNKKALSNLRSQLNSMYERPVRPIKDPSCYIATMAYGNYEHPQVIILRQFRDEVLEHYSLGRCFISFYYKYSPALVERLKNQNLINKVIRFSLDSFIKILKQR